jgi:glycosyltransferase involved in cell wall biosynthesis
MGNPRISLLVPTWRNAAMMGFSMASAFEGAEPGTIEAIVFSQEHGEEVDLMVKMLQGKGHNIFIAGTSQNNEGVALAVNACAQASRGEHLFYVADDYYFLPGWDAAMLRRVRPGTFQYLTARCIEPTGTNPCMYAPHDFGQGLANLKEAELLAWWGTLEKKDVASRWGPPFVERETWMAVGGFDAGYWPGMGTDPDFAMSVGKTAFNRGIQAPEYRAVGDCGMYHMGQAGTTNRVRSYGSTLASRIRFRDKWQTTPEEFGAMVGDGKEL